MNFSILSIVCCTYLVFTNKSHYIFYYSLYKSTDLIILENACEYFVIKSLLVVGQVPPLVFIRYFKVCL